MRWFWATGAAVLAAVGGLYAYSFTLPDRLEVTESAVIDRPAATVFTLLNDLQTFNEWSPWVEKDPNAQFEFQGFEPGVGQSMSWKGDLAVGTGKQTITASEPYRRIELSLEYEGVEPADLTFELKPAGPGVEVFWSFSAPLHSARDRLSAHLFGGATSMREDFRNGLLNLRALAMEIPAADFSRAQIRLGQQNENWIAYRDLLEAEQGPVEETGVMFQELRLDMEKAELKGADTRLVFLAGMEDPTVVRIARALPGPTKPQGDFTATPFRVGEGHIGMVLEAPFGGSADLEKAGALLDVMAAYAMAHRYEVVGNPWIEQGRRSDFLYVPIGY